MSRGTAERVGSRRCSLAALIDDLKPSQALALGTLRAGLPDKVKVTTRQRVNGCRAAGHHRPHWLQYRLPRLGIRPVDHDSKGMPPALAVELKRAGGFWQALDGVLPIPTTAPPT